MTGEGGSQEAKFRQEKEQMKNGKCRKLKKKKGLLIFELKSI